jgi:hypothetical protein
MQTSLSPSVCRAFLGCQIEKAVDELNLPKRIISCHPSNLSLPDHVDCFVALNRSPSRLEFSEALLGRMVKKIERFEKARLAASPSLFGLPSPPSR